MQNEEDALLLELYLNMTAIIIHKSNECAKSAAPGTDLEHVHFSRVALSSTFQMWLMNKSGRVKEKQV